MSTTTRRYIRRSREQWAEFIELQPGSGLSAPKFCEQAGVSYQSFMAWRKKLNTPESSSSDSPKFVELTTPRQTEQPNDSSPTGGEWQVELDLGNGIQLRIAQR